MVNEGYDVGQVCLNGHPITGNAQRYPDFTKKHCPNCGAPTITACTKCRTPIQGDYWVPGVLSALPYQPPAHCHECGTPYPWTAAKLEAAKELAHEAEDLTQEEREQLARSLDDIVADTPRTQLAASRFKRLMGKAGKGTAQAMRDIVVDIASEAARKSIFGA